MTAGNRTPRPLRVRFQESPAARIRVAAATALLVLWGLSGASAARAAEGALQIGFQDGRLQIGGVLQFGSSLLPAYRPQPRIDLFALGSDRVMLGTPVTLSWRTSNATSVQIVTPAQTLAVPADGAMQQIIGQVGTYRFQLIAASAFGQDVREVYLTVLPAIQPPRILSFSISQPLLYGPGYVTLRWQTTGAQFVQIDGIAGLLPACGERAVYVGGSQTFRLTARGAYEQVEALATAVVQPLPRILPQPLPRILPQPQPRFQPQPQFQPQPRFQPQPQPRFQPQPQPWSQQHPPQPGPQQHQPGPQGGHESRGPSGGQHR